MAKHDVALPDGVIPKGCPFHLDTGSTLVTVFDHLYDPPLLHIHTGACAVVGDLEHFLEAEKVESLMPAIPCFLLPWTTFLQRPSPGLNYPDRSSRDLVTLKEKNKYFFFDRSAQRYKLMG